MSARFLQIHTLTSFAASLLNRDDAGFAKRMPFGGATRTRVSSQCLKRHWRTFAGANGWQELGEPATIRSRHTFQRYVFQPLVEEGVDAALAEAVTAALMDTVLGSSTRAKSKKKKGEESTPGESLKTGQITVLGEPEVRFLADVARAVCAEGPEVKKAAKAVKDHLGRDGRANLAALKKASGLSAALFGRMVTSDILARGDAAVHVAHAFTVHEEAAESDYFSAVDDLLGEGDDAQLGSGHIGSVELTSGLFYGYVVVDVPLLVSNIEGCAREAWGDADRDLAAKVVERLLHLVCTVSPGAKLGSTAPYAYAHFALAEWGDAQPRTLANAFLKPVRARPDVVDSAYRALGSHLADLDAMYGGAESRRFAALGPVEALEPGLSSGARATLPELEAWAGARIREGQ